MKRDMDLIRTLLLRMEEATMQGGVSYIFQPGFEELDVPGYDADAVTYHMNLLVDAGLLDAPSAHGANHFIVRGLSWRGHDFLDSVRDPEIWRKAREGTERAGGFTLELLGDLAKGLIKTQIEKHTGIKL